MSETPPEPTQLPAEPDEPKGKGKGRGQDPDKKTGRDRAEEVHARNEERQAEREPDESELPPKPAIEDMPDEDEPVEGSEPVPDEEFLDPEDAREDPTVDDEERPPLDPEIYEQSDASLDDPPDR